MIHGSIARRLLGKVAISGISGLFTVGPCQANAEWAVGEFAGETGQRLALFVRAKVGDRECRFQLDTGANEAVIWHAWHEDGSNARQVSLPVTFDGVTRTAQASAGFAEKVAACPSNETVGSLGNAFFDAGSLVVDLKTPQVRYVAGSVLAHRADAQPMFYARWTWEGGHPLVEIRRSGAEARVGYALLDTGSAAFTLTLQSPEDWDALTGGAPVKAGGRVKAFDIPAWGKSLTCFSAPAEPLRVGAISLEPREVQHCPEPAFKPPLRFLGVLGMKGLGDAVLTIDYRAGRWAVDRP